MRSPLSGSRSCPVKIYQFANAPTTCERGQSQGEGLVGLASQRRRDVAVLMAAAEPYGTDTRARERRDGTATRPVAEHHPFSVTRTLTV